MMAHTKKNLSKADDKSRQLAAFAAHLREMRLQQTRSLLRVSRSLGISTDQLVALELWDEAKLPPSAYRVGLLNKYAGVLGVEQIRPRLISSRPTIELLSRPKRQIIVSRLAVGGLLGLISLAVLSYLGVVTHSLVAPPSLTISSPAVDGYVSSNQVAIEGSVGAETIVQVNGQAVGVDGHQAFQSKLYVRHGQNDITVTAVNSLGRKSEITRHLYYQ